MSIVVAPRKYQLFTFKEASMMRKLVHVKRLICVLFALSSAALTLSSCGCHIDSTDLPQAQLYTAATSAICGTVNESATMALACPSGQTISAVGFASYGTPSGSCGAFAKGSCDARPPCPWFRNGCIGKSSCSVSASNLHFWRPLLGDVQATLRASDLRRSHLRHR